MKLRVLATICLVGAVVGLGVLAGFGNQAWRSMADGQTDIGWTDRLSDRTLKLGAALDYLTLLRGDPGTLQALVADAHAIIATLAEVDHPAARIAEQHLREIVHIGGAVAERAAELVADGASTPTDTLEPAMANQLRIHHAGIVAAADIMQHDAHRMVVQTLRSALGAFVFATALYATLAVIASGMIRRRVSGPLRAIEAGIRRLAVGEPGVRIPVSGDDELGELATCFNDMAAQREAQDATLRDSEERFRQLAENIGEVFWLTDPDKARMLYISPAYEHIWGLSRENLYREPQQWLDPVHPADRERVREASRQQAVGTYDEEYRIVRPDGTVRWISDRAFPVHDAAGRVYRIAGLAKDITDYRDSQRELRERVKELQCLYRVLELTTGGGGDLDAICAEIAVTLPRSLLHDAAAVARVVVDRDEHCSAGWQPPTASLRARVMVVGEPRGYVEVGYPADSLDDESASPFLAQEQTLVDGVAGHIGHMIENRQMAEALAQSERLNAVGQLTGGVAHDFNNLLTVIVGNAQLLADELSASPELQSLAEMIGDAGQRGAELTRRLLAFARRQALAPKAVDVNALLDSMAPILRRTLGEHVELTFEPATGVWRAMVDPHQLENAVLNLCINARDAMRGGGRLIVETTNVDLHSDYAALVDDLTPGDYVMVAVTDTGAGIPTADLERVFEPFYSTKDVGEGTGLGLSMVYGFIKQSGGHVRLYSEPDRGTVVRLYLPRYTGDEEAVIAKPKDGEITGGAECILMVEDDDLVRRYASTQLTALGYQVVEAANGPEAMEFLRRGDHFDLLFSDVVMPGGMSGRDLATAARELRPGLRVLFTSGYTESAIVHHGRLDPGVQLLSKPYRRADLARRIRAALDSPPDG